MVWEDATPKSLLTPSSFDNAVTCGLACGGSTNAAIHLIAMARRAGVPLDLERFDAISRKTPVIANLRPSGKYLMEDFYYAGGLRALLGSIRDLLDLDAKTVSGRTLGENLEGAKIFNPDVILPRERALIPSAGSRCCAATSRPTAPSSSLRPRSLACCSKRPGVVFRGLQRPPGRASTIRR